VSTLTEDQRYGAALASLGASPVLLRKFLDGYDARGAWEAIARGTHRADRDRRYRARAVPDTLVRVARVLHRSGISVVVLGTPGYPPALAQDRQAPAVLFSTGHVGVLEARPRVAVVGTRSATRYGLGVATDLGRDLARAGVVVVSGVAPGIDAAAHAGALGVEAGAPTVGVLGTSLEATTARSDSALRQALGGRGAVLSEVSPGGPGGRWWFALRHRVVAALAQVVVVVECHHRGASFDTVAAALARGVTVGAVPGSVRSPASAGTNRLLTEGAVPIRDVDDVVTALELAVAGRPDLAPPNRRKAAAPRPPSSSVPSSSVRDSRRLTGPARRVRQALDQDPITLEAVVRRSGLSLGDVSLALEELAEAGLAVAEQGWWSRAGR
jgi:DNA processing protein